MCQHKVPSSPPLHCTIGKDLARVLISGSSELLSIPIIAPYKYILPNASTKFYSHPLFAILAAMATDSFVASCNPADDSGDSDNIVVSAIRPNESISQQIPIEKTPSDASGPDTVSSYSIIAASQSRIRRSHVWQTYH